MKKNLKRIHTSIEGLRKRLGCNNYEELEEIYGYNVKEYLSRQDNQEYDVEEYLSHQEYDLPRNVTFDLKVFNSDPDYYEYWGT